MSIVLEIQLLITEHEWKESWFLIRDQLGDFYYILNIFAHILLDPEIRSSFYQCRTYIEKKRNNILSINLILREATMYLIDCGPPCKHRRSIVILSSAQANFVAARLSSGALRNRAVWRSNAIRVTRDINRPFISAIIIHYRITKRSWPV